MMLGAPTLHLSAQRQVSVTAGEIAVDAARATLHAGALRLVAAAADVVAQRLTRIAGAFHAVADTVTGHCRTRVSVVDEIDSAGAGVALMESKEAMMLKGAQVLVDAKQTMRVDGEHILMG